VLRDASPCEVLEDEPDTVAEAVQTTVRLYQPPVTNDDRTELFWAPEEPRLNPAPAADAPSSGSQSARTAWPRPRLRPPRGLSPAPPRRATQARRPAPLSLRSPGR
jgi:hypothetical protein